MFDLFDNVWGDSPEVVLDHCADITLAVCQLWILPHNFMTELPLQIALFVIGVAGISLDLTSSLILILFHYVVF